ncbi:DUF2927 domain-containing protein [Sedimentitalea sp. JM2-8]|uniref:DUF2927 domain-containing protein n=1 Tax=Sedimentitalea xiamensis TaxID=3050037 RepID=A0ABT7FEW2_9RHOB|nr:DUF2927 domain-containing protein [Sedimentitalea xiamensis]MDK3073656.1 DUF2927 domain-containing protein [Sedimentitalea xiamensis]
MGLKTSPTPQARPAGLKPPDTTPAPRSAASEDLARYYARVQNDLLTRGLLRTDGGGPDTPFSADALARNFETIAFYDEYTTGTGVATRGNGKSGHLSRWSGPIRIRAEFGASVPPEQRETDQARVAAYAGRLSAITGHPIGVVSRNANFNVFIVGEDDNDFLIRRLVEVIPGISQTELDLFRNLPRSFYCLVIAVSGSRTPYQYTRAVALIRAEHPDLVRQSCIHEEIAQGLGLPNDSPSARPSIFNDDDEFALLTNHDELLLKMLYDPRLELGMTADEARPVARIIARDLMGQQL